MAPQALRLDGHEDFSAKLICLPAFVGVGLACVCGSCFVCFVRDYCGFWEVVLAKARGLGTTPRQSPVTCMDHAV